MLAPTKKVGVIAKGKLDEGATNWAQGGVAAVLEEGDSFDAHVNDTMIAGAGLNNLAVVEHIGASPAILLQNHGVFTIGKTPWEALKAAVMAEDVAKTVHLAELKGRPIEIPPEEVARAHKAYMEKYGQRPAG